MREAALHYPSALVDMLVFLLFHCHQNYTYSCTQKSVLWKHDYYNNGYQYTYCHRISRNMEDLYVCIVAQYSMVYCTAHIE